MIKTNKWKEQGKKERCLKKSIFISLFLLWEALQSAIQTWQQGVRARENQENILYWWKPNNVTFSSKSIVETGLMSVSKRNEYRVYCIPNYFFSLLKGKLIVMELLVFKV